MVDSDALIAFWFAPATQVRWFRADPDFDAEIRSRFGSLVERAAAGDVPNWAATADGALALCLLLDQLPRNIWRGSPRAFSCDAMARKIAYAAIAAGRDRTLATMRRHFLYLPLEHSEDSVDQETCVTLMRGLGDAEMLDYAQRHRDIIARFGRFPHRNAILGRASTGEETEFLQQPDSSF